MTETTPIVRAGEEQISLPTYLAHAADPNPMFLEKRVYQGSSGKVYPNPFTDRISTEKSDRSYRSIYLENEYVRLTILPEIGGRIFTGEDKTNGYDFFYRQNVIKPALVGLLGPWISGGVEFNWPQHHRPSTFMPVHATIERGEDGSATVWLSEHDPMLRMKGMVGICLYPGRSVVEAKVRLYNRTPFVQTFLWWANVAVHVHERYQAFFPPDVSHVADHAKRAVSHFPIARNFYYGVDYTDGVDLRWYKNIPVPTSYMVTQSKFDFAGGYDHERQAGFVHVADRHVAPGKKLWTWGSGEFGKAWDRNLTDSDGPYVELMAGVYTDNQPDFSWTHPYETKTFSQFWYPIQKIGPVACANVRAALSMESDPEHIRIGVCASESLPDSSIEVLRGKDKIFSAGTNLAPGEPWTDSFECKHELDELHFELRDANGNLVLEYQPEETSLSELPASAMEPLQPAEIECVGELYITGLHLEQYRHATRSPESYWEEGLRRDPGDARINNAMGLLALRRGEFVCAENFFRAAIARLTLRNPNPLDSEAYYNLGLVLCYQDRVKEAYSAFYKATWSYNWRSVSHFELAKIFCQRRNFVEALQHLEECLKTDTENLKARDLQAAVLRRMERKEQARNVLDETLRLDPLDFLAHAERSFLDSSRADDAIRELDEDIQTALDVAYDYAGAGLLEEGLAWLQTVVGGTNAQYPMLFYTLAWLADRLGDGQAAEEYRKRAADAPSLYCFPARLEEMVVLQEALRHEPTDAKASYYLGNFYYDRKRYDEAIVCWRDSVMADPTFSIPWRNLGIADYNHRHDPEAAFAAYAKAFAVNPNDARLLYEFDQLKKRRNFAPEERLAALEARNDLVEHRDDLTIETITLLNLTGQHERALSILLKRRFNPWEGGEGLVSAQYVEAHTALGRMAMETGDFLGAVQHFQQAREYPKNLGEGKHLLTLERQLDYWEGLALEQIGDTQGAQELYRAAAAPLQGHSVHSFYRAQALHQLGREDEGQAALKELCEYARRHRNEEPGIDYFATSLPNFLLFEDDLKKRNAVDCLVLEAYAELGLGQLTRARELFLEIVRLDSSNSEAQQEISRLQNSSARWEQAGV
jgi:tetratricopeptide (TPR) repeat protein